MICIRDVVGSNLDQDTNCVEDFCGFLCDTVMLCILYH